MQSFGDGSADNGYKMKRFICMTSGTPCHILITATMHLKKNPIQNHLAYFRYGAILKTSLFRNVLPDTKRNL